MLDQQQLDHAVDHSAAFRRRRRLQPAGGKGDKIFPPTYPGEGRNASPRHVLETRRVDGEEVICVLIDSVQSQANRLEEALLTAAKAGQIPLPRLVVDFPGSGLNSVPEISSLEAPHRVFDAILRDSLLDGVPFRESDAGRRVRQATPHDATAILEVSPTALLFGAWNSTGEGGGLGAKFARAIVSEIIGVDVPSERTSTQAGAAAAGELRTAARRTGSRIDPLGILRSVEVFKGETDWDVSEKAAGKKAKKVRPSEINHGNIAPSVVPLGATCEYALQVAVITLAGLRRLHFGPDARRNHAARAYLASLGLLALVEADVQGYALRSRCDLVCEGEAPIELVQFDGRSDPVALDLAAARSLHRAAYEAAQRAGFSLRPEPITLQPQQKLVHIVRESQRKALEDAGTPDAEE
ncbi:MAG: type I-G CRISPR-associated RAMP protein Csb1/Cas7g [Acetobacteraceae bacterium]